MTKSFSRMRVAKFIALPLFLWQGIAWSATEIRPEIIEVGAFGMHLAAALNDRNAEQVAQLLDLRALGQRAAQSMMSNDREIEAFVKAFESSAKTSVVDATVTMLKRQNGAVKFMKVVRRGSETRPLLRYDFGDMGFDYAEYVLERSAASELRATDWYQLTRGQLISKSVSVASKLLIDPNPGFIQSLLGVREFDTSSIKTLRSVGNLQRAGKYREALDLLDSLPASLLSVRIFATQRVFLASMTKDDVVYRKALAGMAEKFGNDPDAAMMLLDHYYYTGDIDKVLNCISLIEGRVGVDGLTELLRANILYSKERFAEMLAHAHESVRLEPDRLPPYWLVALGYIHLNQFDHAIETYSAIAKRFDYKFTRQDFAAKPELSDFVASTAFKKWLRPEAH